MELTFMETRMIHWPDSMFTYLAKDQLLFSQDAFGMHLATLERVLPTKFRGDAGIWRRRHITLILFLPYSPIVFQRLWKRSRQAGTENQKLSLPITGQSGARISAGLLIFIKNGLRKKPTAESSCGLWKQCGISTEKIWQSAIAEALLGQASR